MTCPHCGAESVKHDHTEGHATPVAGDVSICPGCRCVSVYTEGRTGLFRRKPTPAEQDKIMADVRVAEALGALANHGSSYAAVAALRRAVQR